MNGYELANQFRRVRKKLCFSSIEADLFYELVAICNDEGWPDTFQYPNALLCATIGASEKSLISARNRLQQAGLLNFISGYKRNPTKYSFLPLPEVSKSGSKSGSDNGSKSGSRTGRNTSDSYKTKRETKTKTKEEGDADASHAPHEAPLQLKTLPGEEEKEKASAQKEKEETEMKRHQEFVDLYHNWYQDRAKIPPRYFEADFKAIKSIRRYLTESKKGDHQKALSTWRYILDNWGKLEDFLQRQTKLTQVDRNMVNILNQLRSDFKNVSNGNNTTNSTKQPAGETAEQAAARYRAYNPNKHAKAAG